MDSERAIERNVERLYLAHHGWLKGWLRRRPGEHADAEDLAQDTSLRSRNLTPERSDYAIYSGRVG